MTYIKKSFIHIPRNEGFLLFTVLLGYRTKRVGFIGDGASKLLAPSLF